MPRLDLVKAVCGEGKGGEGKGEGQVEGQEGGQEEGQKEGQKEEWQEEGQEEGRGVSGDNVGCGWDRDEMRLGSGGMRGRDEMRVGSGGMRGRDEMRVGSGGAAVGRGEERRSRLDPTERAQRSQNPRKSHKDHTTIIPIPA